MAEEMFRKLLEFLRSRGLNNSQLQSIEADKIDADAILSMNSMNDQQLKNYIVAYGDRVATVAFCKGLKNTDHRTEKTLDRIRQKNLLSKKCSKLQGNKHAKKTQRRVELGIKQYDFFTKTYKQVRSQSGGGIRHLSVTVDSKLLEILQYGKDLFFPDGHNCFGSFDEFEVSLYDFQGHPAKLDQTLAECYDEFKLKLLRVYVYTKKKCPVTDGESTCAVEQTPQDDCPSVDSLEKQVTPEHTHVPPQESLSLGEASPGSCCVKKAEEHMVEAGTPTVLIKQSVLQGPSSSQDDSVSDVEILDLPVIHFRKRRSLNLKNNSPDIKRQSESEDSDSMAAAVRASLDDNGKSLQEILIELSSQIDQHGDANLVNVDRNNILDGARRGFTRKKFRAECKLSIKFSGEYGIDEGGPSREFMRLALKAIHESPIFEGEENAKIICPDLPSADRNDYYIFGKMIAYFIVHKGPSPCFFSSTMYQLLAGKPCYPNIADVGDFEIRTQLQMIKETEDLRKISLPESIMQAVEYVGAVPLLSLNKKDKILDALLDYFVLNRVKGVLSQFLDGLSSLGILKAIREFPVTMRPLFIYQKAAAATTAYIEELFVPLFSTEGSNKYVEELRTQSHWRDFLEDLAEQPDGLESLLRFVTGLDAAPALGFEPHPSLKFNHPDTENPFDGTPYANTCTNTLSLPVVHNYETFCERMNMALSLGTFFSNA